VSTGAASGAEGDPTGSADQGEDLSCAQVPADGPTFGPDREGPPWFPNTRCDPHKAPDDEGPHTCCSDDPAAPGGLLPDYLGRGIDGATPIFSGDGNERSDSGVCVRVSDIDDGLFEDAAAGCPVPCNPTWSLDEIGTVCGPQAECCQTRLLEPEDCIVDDGVWRPATGADILEGDQTFWAPADHKTHQDNNGIDCSEFAGGVKDEVFFDCVLQLSVADQRGFCGPRGSCPIDPGFVDACEAMN
jgi:hypothetical protein